MRMTAGVRKVALTMHVATSVGWLGAVGGFLALAIAGLASANADTIRASYLAMELVGWTVIVPLALISTPTGVVMSLGTEWGLVRHYWEPTIRWVRVSNDHWPRQARPAQLGRRSECGRR